MKRVIIYFIATAFTAVITGCATDEYGNRRPMTDAEKGALIGATSGAAIGALAKNIQRRHVRRGVPLKVTGPSAAMPARVQRRTDIAAIVTGSAGDFGFFQKIEQGSKRTWMTEQVTIFGGFRDAVMDAGQSAGDRANHPAISQFAHEVFEE